MSFWLLPADYRQWEWSFAGSSHWDTGWHSGRRHGSGCLQKYGRGGHAQQRLHLTHPLSQSCCTSHEGASCGPRGWWAVSSKNHFLLFKVDLDAPLIIRLHGYDRKQRSEFFHYRLTVITVQKHYIYYCIRIHVPHCCFHLICSIVIFIGKNMIGIEKGRA